MLQVLLLLVSTFGYYLLMYILFHGRKTALYPTFFVSGIVMLGMLAGLTNCLQHIYSFLYVAGFGVLPACVGYLIWKKPKYFHPTLHTVLPLLLLIGGTIYLYTTLEGRFLHGYDDFTHWGKVARVIAEGMRLPTDGDLLSHASYPPGTALFISYISNILGSTEGTWLFAQAFMLLSFWLSLLSATRRIGIQITLAVFAALFMHFSISLEVMNVDNLLAACVTAGMMTCLAEEGRPGRFILPLSVCLCAAVLIKNSGILFYLMTAGYAVVLYRKKHKSWSPILLTLTAPLILFALWGAYVDGEFTSQMSHQISTEYYQMVLNEKSSADIQAIFRLILPIMLNPQRNTALWLIPGYILVAVACWQKGTQARLGHVVWFSALLFVLYEAGILLMYVFSMPMTEILYQNGKDYDRYNNTLVAFLCAMLLWLAVSIIAPGKEKKSFRQFWLPMAAATASVFIVLPVLYGQQYPTKTIEYRRAKAPAAYAYAQLKPSLADIPVNASYVVLFEKEENEGYHRYMSRYYLQTKDIVLCYDEQTAQEYRTAEPWRYYVDLANGTIQLPTETVGVQLYTRTASTACDNALNTVGYQENTRLSTSTGSEVTAYGWDMTGYIPAKVGDVIRLENVSWKPTDENGASGGIFWFTEEKEFNTHRTTVTAEDLANWNPVFDENGNIVQITLPSGVRSSTRYIRIVCQDINTSSIVTVNEEIQ